MRATGQKRAPATAPATRHVRALIALLIFASPASLSAKTDSWTPLGLSGESVTALTVGSPGLVYAGTSSGAIFKIADRVQTWLTEDLGEHSNPVTAIAASLKDSATVYACTTDGLFKSTNSGVSWTIPNGDLIGCIALSIDPQNPNVVYAAGSAGLFKSTDAGANWIRTSLAPTAVNLVIDPQNPETIYAATPTGVVNSTDGGANWTVYPASPGSVRGLAIDPQTPTTLYVGSLTGGVFKSTDSGRNWSASGLSSNPVFAMVVDVQESSTIYAATETGPYKSVDGGRTWFSISEGLSAKTTAIAGDLALCRIYIGTRNGAFETDIGPVLTLHSDLCVGREWTLVISHAGGNMPIRLLGVSSEAVWEIPQWGITNGAGMFITKGIFPLSTEGTHQLRVAVGGVLSNFISFAVASCR